MIGYHDIWESFSLQSHAIFSYRILKNDRNHLHLRKMKK